MIMFISAYPQKPDKFALSSGMNLIPTKIYSVGLDMAGFPGTEIVIDDVEDRDIGSIGSNNILGWLKISVTGVVTDAGARDTDEVGLESVPL